MVIYITEVYKISVTGVLKGIAGPGKKGIFAGYNVIYSISVTVTVYNPFIPIDIRQPLPVIYSIMNLYSFLCKLKYRFRNLRSCTCIRINRIQLLPVSYEDICRAADTDGCLTEIVAPVDMVAAAACPSCRSLSPANRYGRSLWSAEKAAERT